MWRGRGVTCPAVSGPLSEYCETDSALQAERARIEKQLTDFQNGLWNDAETEQTKTTAVTADKKQKEAKEPKPKKEKTPRAPRQSASSGERISVHR